MKHTHGPWKWMKRGNGEVFLGTPDRGLLVVMDFVRAGMNGAQPRFAAWTGQDRGRMGGVMKKADDIYYLEDYPDARLIVAAPDLLEALVDLVKLIETDDLVPESVSYMKQAREALAKATGEVKV